MIRRSLINSCSMVEIAVSIAHDQASIERVTILKNQLALAKVHERSNWEKPSSKLSIIWATMAFLSFVSRATSTLSALRFSIYNRWAVLLSFSIKFRVRRNRLSPSSLQRILLKKWRRFRILWVSIIRTLWKQLRCLWQTIKETKKSFNQ